MNKCKDCMLECEIKDDGIDTCVCNVEVENNAGVETCVCCGEVIPEGRQICLNCERALDKR